jgi:hypothetical protein
MITRDLYDVRLKESTLLLGQRVDREAARLIYERIKNSYTDSDCTQAFDQCVEHEDRLNYPNIRRRLDEAKNRREEQEWALAKRQEEREAMLFWQGKTESSIANAHSRVVKKILNKEASLLDGHRELAEVYPGIGHEHYIPDMEPF